MACRNIFVKFENIEGGGEGIYDLVDSQNRVVFENLSSSELANGMTFSVDNDEIQFRLTNFRLYGDESPCATTSTTTTTTTALYAWLFGRKNAGTPRAQNLRVYNVSSMSLEYDFGTISNHDTISATTSWTSQALTIDENKIYLTNQVAATDPFTVTEFSLQPFEYQRKIAVTGTFSTSAGYTTEISTDGKYIAAYGRNTATASFIQLLNADDFQLTTYGFTGMNLVGEFSPDSQTYYWPRWTNSGSTLQFYFIDKVNLNDFSVTTYGITQSASGTSNQFFGSSNPRMAINTEGTKLFSTAGSRSYWVQFDTSNFVNPSTYSRGTTLPSGFLYNGEILYNTQKDLLFVASQWNWQASPLRLAFGFDIYSGTNSQFIKSANLTYFRDSVLNDVTFQQNSQFSEDGNELITVLVPTINGSTTSNYRMRRYNIDEDIITGTVSLSNDWAIAQTNKFLSTRGPSI